MTLCSRGFLYLS